MRRSAFTLMELLIVISIMMILLGMIMGGVMYAKNQAMATKTRAAVSDLDSYLQAYRTMSGRFPDDQTVFSELASNPTCLSIPTGDWASINTKLSQILKDAGQPVKPSMVDAWAIPLHYRPARFYPYTAGATPAIDSDDPPGLTRESFQLWSTGKDKKDQGGEAGSDDITSWPK